MSHLDRLDARDRDILHRILANSSRRAAITILDRGAIGLDDLTREAATLEATEPADDAIERMVLSSRHVHLPMLEDAGIVRCVPEMGRVALLDRVTGKRTENRLPTLLLESIRS